MKKYIAWDVFHLSLILSLIRLYPELYRSSSLQNIEPLSREEILGPSSAYTQTNFHHNLNNRLHGYIHPKNFDDSIARTLFINDLNSLINRPNWETNPPQNNIFAYILNDQLPVSGLDQSVNPNRTTSNSDSSGVLNQSQVLPSLVFPEERTVESNELSQEDMDLIEILWKQDIDLGISREVFDGTWNPDNHEKTQEPLYKDKLLQNKSENATAEEPIPFPNPWDGVAYSIDSETGEHILSPAPVENASSQAYQEVPNDDFDNISLEEALQFFENDVEAPRSSASKYSESTRLYTQSVFNETDANQSYTSSKNEEHNEIASSQALPALPSSLEDFDIENRNLPLLEQLNEISNLALEARALNETHTNQWAENAFPQHMYNQANDSAAHMGGSTVNYSNALLQNTTLPIPLDNQTTATDLLDEFLLSLIANGTDVPDPLPSEQYDDIPADFLQDNFTTEDDFLESFFNNEVMNLMNQSVLSSLPKEDNNSTVAQAQASEDSAVSSMGSENEWQEEAISYQGIERNWNERTGKSSNGTSSDSSASNSVAEIPVDLLDSRTEKKYNSRDSKSYSSDSGCGQSNLLTQRYDGASNRVFGSFSRFAEGSSGYSKLGSSSTRHVDTSLHNHTYSYSNDVEGDEDSMDTPFERDKKYSDSKKGRRKAPESFNGDETSQSCRDEKRARELKLPLTTKEITTLPIEEFNERLTKFDLTDDQLNLIRDIRRRGKNKIAAQNCRKRKMDQIFELQHTLEDLELERQKLTNEQSVMSHRRDFLQSKFNKLYKFICDMGPNPGPPDPPGYFPNRGGAGAMRSSPEFPLVHNSTNFNNLDNAAESSGHGGARVKRKVNKNN